MKPRLRVMSDYDNVQRAFQLRGAMIASLTQRIGGLMQENARLLNKLREQKEQMANTVLVCDHCARGVVVNGRCTRCLRRAK